MHPAFKGQLIIRHYKRNKINQKKYPEKITFIYLILPFFVFTSGKLLCIDSSVVPILGDGHFLHKNAF